MKLYIMMDPVQIEIASVFITCDGADAEYGKFIPKFVVSAYQHNFNVSEISQKRLILKKGHQALRAQPEELQHLMACVLFLVVLALDLTVLDPVVRKASPHPSSPLDWSSSSSRS